jgi:hypothetical protein
MKISDKVLQDKGLTQPHLGRASRPQPDVSTPLRSARHETTDKHEPHSNTGTICLRARANGLGARTVAGMVCSESRRYPEPSQSIIRAVMLS